MKLHVMSDIHMEHYHDHGQGLLDRLDGKGVDALILAGDITSAKYTTEWQRDMAAFTDIYAKVFYVPGNHEFYGASAPVLMDALRVTATYLGEGFTLLDHTSPPERWHGQRFIGGTMWFRDLPDNFRWADHISDFHVIRDFLPWVYDENKAMDAYLTAELQPSDVVVTHHLPSHQSIGEQYIGAQSNRFFLHDVHHLITQRQPALWVHGHTHDGFDYKVGGTRVVCHPRGYPREKYAKDEYRPMEIEI